VHIYTTSLDPNLEMLKDVGGIVSGTTVDDLTGRTISSIIDDLLFPTIFPTHTEPSISGFNLSNTSSPVEIGSSAKTITSATLDRGKWSNFNDDLPYAGTAETITYEIKINNQTYNNISSLPSKYTTVGNQTYKVTISYGDGPSPKDNKGVIVDDYYAPASSVTLTRTVNVTYPIYATTVLYNEENGGYYGNFETTKLIPWSGSTNITTGEIVLVKQEKTTEINRKQRFKIPRILKKVQTKNTLSANPWVDSTSDWVIVNPNGSNENVNGINVKYYTYYYNSNSSIGEQIIKITF
jgi:hypothetical protein